MKQILITFLFCFSSIYVFASEDICETLEKDYQIENPFEWFNGVIDREIRTFNKIVVIGEKKKALIRYAEKINSYIIDYQIDLLNENISPREFERYDYNYWDGARQTGNIAVVIKNELKNRKGPVYSLLFNRSTQRGEEEISSATVDIRSFLRCFRDRIEWHVFFNPKLEQYDIWFSMPIGFLVNFSYFHYVVKEINGKFILVGF